MGRIACCIAVLVLMLGIGQAQAGGGGYQREYCCICDNCNSGAAVQCSPDIAFGPVDTNCDVVCADRGCSLQQVSLGSCGFGTNAALCALPVGAAPAASPMALAATASLLIAAGFGVARRKASKG